MLLVSNQVISYRDSWALVIFICFDIFVILSSPYFTKVDLLNWLGANLNQYGYTLCEIDGTFLSRKLTARRKRKQNFLHKIRSQPMSLCVMIDRMFAILKIIEAGWWLWFNLNSRSLLSHSIFSRNKTAQSKKKLSVRTGHIWWWTVNWSLHN